MIEFKKYFFLFTRKIYCSSKILFSILVLIICFGLFKPYHYYHTNLFFDAASYMSHSYTISLDGDLDYSNEIFSINNSSLVREKFNQTPPNPFGGAILNFPIVFIFSQLDIYLNHPVIKNRLNFFGSWSYFGIGFSSLLFFLGGTFLYFRFLKDLFPNFSRKLNILLILSSGISFYSLNNFTLIHSHEYFLISAILYLSLKIFYSNKYFPFKICLLGFLYFTLYFTRPSDVTIFFLPAFLFFYLRRWFPHLLNIKFEYIKIFYFVLISFFYFLVMLLLNQRLYNVYFQDFLSVYGPTEINLSLYSINIDSIFRDLINIFFGLDFGLLFSNFLFFIGLSFFIIYVFVEKFDFSILASSLLIIVPPIILVLIFKSNSGSYGYRYLFSIFPLMIIFFNHFYSRLLKIKFSLVFIFFFSIFSIYSQAVYSTDDKFSPSPNINNFGEFHSSSFIDYEKNAIVHLFNWDTHKLIFLKRFPGYLLSIIFEYNFLINFTDINDSDKSKYSQLYNIYNNLHVSKIFFLILIGVFVPGFLVYIAYRI